MNNVTLKTQICDALATWIRQRPGLEFGNYGDVSSYRSEMRSIAKDKRDAETLLQAVRWRDSITAENLIEAAKRAFSGRLEIKIEKFWQVADSVKTRAVEVKIDYTPGQYWPTEYRKAAAAVLASALWYYMKENMPSPVGKVVSMHSGFETEAYGEAGLNAGDWLRRSFRKEFGSALQRRWFN